MPSLSQHVKPVPYDDPSSSFNDVGIVNNNSTFRSMSTLLRLFLFSTTTTMMVTVNLVCALTKCNFGENQVTKYRL
jgi:hypothetical protein